MRPIKYQLSDLELDSVDEEKQAGVFQINTPRIDIRQAMEKVETAIAAKEKKKTNDAYNLVEIVKPKISLYDEYMNFLNPGKQTPSKTLFGMNFHDSGFESLGQKTYALNFKSRDAPNLLYNYTPKLDMPVFILPRTSMKVSIEKRSMTSNKSTSLLNSQTMIASRHSSSAKTLAVKSKKNLNIDPENGLSKTQTNIIRPQTKTEVLRTTTATMTRTKFRAAPVHEGTLPQLLGFKKGKFKVELL